jgi:hypothetical protein
VWRLATGGALFVSFSRFRAPIPAIHRKNNLGAEARKFIIISAKKNFWQSSWSFSTVSSGLKSDFGPFPALYMGKRTDRLMAQSELSLKLLRTLNPFQQKEAQYEKAYR